LGDADWLASMVTQFVGFAGTHYLADPVHDPGRYGTQGLFVVVAFADHQSPIDLSQSRIDPSCSIGRQLECAFDAVIAGLGDALARLVSTARRVGTWKQTAEAAELVQSCMPPPTTSSTSNVISLQPKRTARFALAMDTWRTAVAAT
jgi:hypothetical protein